MKYSLNKSNESFGLSSVKSSGKYESRNEFYEEIKDKAINQIKGYVTQKGYTVPSLQEIESMVKIAKQLKLKERANNPIGGGKELIGKGEFKLIEDIPVYTYMGRISDTSKFITKLVGMITLITVSGLTFGKQAGVAIGRKAYINSNKIIMSKYPGTDITSTIMRGCAQIDALERTKTIVSSAASIINVASGIFGSIGFENLAAFIQNKRGKKLIFAYTFIKNKRGKIKIKGISYGELVNEVT